MFWASTATWQQMASEQASRGERNGKRMMRDSKQWERRRAFYALPRPAAARMAARAASGQVAYQGRQGRRRQLVQPRRIRRMVTADAHLRAAFQRRLHRRGKF